MKCCKKYTDYLEQTLNSVPESHTSVENLSYINVVRRLLTLDCGIDKQYPHKEVPTTEKLDDLSPFKPQQIDSFLPITCYQSYWIVQNLKQNALPRDIIALFLSLFHLNL